MSGRKTINNRIHFTYDSSTREILLEGNVITDRQVREIADVHDKHLIPEKSTRYHHESLIFSIANQRTRYEGVLRFMNKIHAMSDSEILDPERVYHVAMHGNNKLWYRENRFEPSYRYMEEHGGIDKFVQSFLDKPYETRQILDDDVKWFGLKTASLWYLCLGGNDGPICIDVHNTIQSKGLGISIPENNYIPKVRGSGLTKGRKVHSQVSGNLYMRVERELTDVFMNSKLVERYPQYFLNDKGTLNGSFVSALLWWQGTQGYRGNHASQLYLFDDVLRFQNPFSPK